MEHVLKPQAIDLSPIAAFLFRFRVFQILFNIIILALFFFDLSILSFLFLLNLDLFVSTLFDNWFFESFDVYPDNIFILGLLIGLIRNLWLFLFFFGILNRWRTRLRWRALFYYSKLFLDLIILNFSYQVFSNFSFFYRANVLLIYFLTVNPG